MDVSFVHTDLFAVPAFVLALNTSPGISGGISDADGLALSLPGISFNCKIPEALPTVSPRSSTGISSALEALASIPENKRHFTQLHIPSEDEKNQLRVMTPEERQKKQAEYSFLIGKPVSKDLAESSSEILSDGVGTQQYLQQQWNEGSFCELTQSPRSVHIQYRCVPGLVDHISLVQEVSTCVYRVVVGTSRLCRDPAFRPRDTEEKTIECSGLATAEKKLIQSPGNDAM